MFNDRESVAPILLSMFLGLLVVILIGGFAANLMAKSKNKNMTEEQIKAEQMQKADDQSTDKVSFWTKMKQKFTTRKEDTSAPQENAADTTKALSPTAAASNNNIDSFMAMLSTSQISELNDEKGEIFSVFMPHNQAFSNAQEAIQNLKNRNNPSEMQALMKRHIVRGKVSQGVSKTLSDEEVFVDFKNNTVSFDGITAHIVEIRGDTLIIDKVLY